MKNPKYQIFQGKGGQYYFRLRAGNGQIVLGSEGYTSKAAAENGIQSVKMNGIWDTQFDRQQSKDGQHYFTLRAGNNEVIGRGERYKSKSSMENGIRSIMSIAATCPTEDTTA